MSRAATENEREVRRLKVAEGLLAHRTALQIAADLKVNRNTVNADVAAIRREWAEYRADAFDRYSAEELLRLEALEAVQWPKAMAGDPWAWDRCLALSRERRLLLGTNAPMMSKIEVIDPEVVHAAVEERRARLRLLEARTGTDA